MEDPHSNLFSRGASPPPSIADLLGHIQSPPATSATQGQGQGAYTQAVQQSTPQTQSQPMASQSMHNLADAFTNNPSGPSPNQARELSPPHSLRDVPVSNSSGPNPLESLFHHLNPQLAPAHHSHGGQDVYTTQQQQQSSSAPATPMSTATVNTTASAPNNGYSSGPERQHALLSLLGTVASPGGNASGASTMSSPPMNSAPATQIAGQFQPYQQHIQQQTQQPHIQQVPTPPGSSHQFMPPSSSGAGPGSDTSQSQSQTQGRMLLDHLMSGTGGGSSNTAPTSINTSPPASRTTFDSPLHSLHTLASTPYGASPYTPIAPQQQHQFPPMQHQSSYEPESGHLGPDPYGQYATQQAPQQPQQVQVSTQGPGTSSSPQRTPFDFVSPFDALSGAGGQQGQSQSHGGPGSNVPKKPVPVLSPQGPSPDNNNSSGWPVPPTYTNTSTNSMANDPKRRSVDNLLDQLTRPQGSNVTNPQGPSAAGVSQEQYDAYLSGEPTQDVSQAQEPRVVAPAQAPPLPSAPKAGSGQAQQRNDTASPRGSPPKPHQGQMHAQVAQLRPQARAMDSADSMTSQGTATATGGGSGKRNKESSPGPRGAWKDRDNGSQGRKAGKVKQSQASQQAAQQSQGPSQGQTITLDLSSPLEEIRAPRDSIKNTPIALVKVEPSYLPGTTIGATQWVAYAMSKGRVRVISRSSGERILLQLPSTFPTSALVVDMAVYGNRLAGVTSDGGFVVWELPEAIQEDITGRILLCIYPSPDIDPLQFVKWHPKQPDTLAVASESKIYLLNILEADSIFGGAPITQADLAHASAVFSMPAPLVAFDFDVHHFAIGTVSVDGTLTLWSVRDKQPFWAQRIRGEDTPSSVSFVERAVIIGRRNGTVFQLLPVMSKTVTATIKVVRSGPHTFSVATESPTGPEPAADMFGRALYDNQSQTIWITNNSRESVFGVRVAFEPPSGDEEYVRPYVTAAVEFAGVKPAIHFVLLSAEAEQLAIEADAACVAAKINPGPVSLVGFSIHAGGVDQVLIRNEWYENAFAQAQAKLPAGNAPPPAPSQAQVNVSAPAGVQDSPARNSRQQLPGASQQTKAKELLSAPQRGRTPPSEEIEAEALRAEEGRVEPKGPRSHRPKGGPGLWALEKQEREERERVDKERAEKERAHEDVGSGRERERERTRTDKEDRLAQTGYVATPPQQQVQLPPPTPHNVMSEAAIGSVFQKEMKKLEENLHSRLGRLVGKELDKQQQRMDEIRVGEQHEDVLRQEKLIKLISSELTRNTTRLVENAVKTEVQNSVLPSLENITKTELKNALNGSLAKNLVDTVKQTLPGELERLFTRQDITTNLARSFSANIAPVIERHVKDTMNQSIMPNLKAQAAANHQELLQTMQAEIDAVKSTVVSVHNEAVRSQENAIRDLEQIVRKLSEQVKYLSMSSSPAIGARSSPSHTQQGQAPQQQAYAGAAPQYSSQLRQAPINAQPTYAPPPQPQYSQPAPPPQASSSNNQWYQPPMLAPQASHPTLPPPVAPIAAPQQPQATGQVGNMPPRSEEWDDTYLHVLGSDSFQQLQDLLSRSDPDSIMPLQGHVPLSQAVILTLIHRLSTYLGEISPMDEAFPTTLWWLQRTALVLEVGDPLIASYIPRVLPQVQQSLTTTRQRLTILPGAPPQLLDAARSISEVQGTLNRKPLTA